MRSKASTSSKKVALLEKGTQVTITKEVFKSKKSTAKKYKWYYVKVDGKKGYIRSDLLKSIKYQAVTAKVTSKVNYRKGAGTKMKKAGSLKKGTAVTVYLAAKPVSSTKGTSSTWYKIKVGSKYYYAASSRIDIVGSIFVNNTNSALAGSYTPNNFSAMSDAEYEAYLTSQGFPEEYKVRLRALHKAHPNWAFIACNTGVNWNDAISRETKKGVSAIHQSLPTSYRSTAKFGALFADEAEQAATETAPVQAEPAVEEPAAEQAAEVPAGEAAEAPAEAVETAPEAAAEPATEETAEQPSVKVTIEEDLAYRELPDNNLPEAGSFTAGTELTVTASVIAAKQEETLQEETTSVAEPSEAAEQENTPEWYQVQLEDGSVYVAAEKINIGAAAEAVAAPEALAAPEPEMTEVTAEEAAAEEPAVTTPELPQLTAEEILNRSEENSTETAEEPAPSEEAVPAEQPAAEETAPSEEPAPAEEAAPAEDTPVALEQPDMNAVNQDASMATYTKVEPGWYNASATAVAYYMDPRNFLNEDRIYMFEDLSYRPEYQTAAVVAKILTPTVLPGYGFTPDLFMAAGSTYNVSPVFLAARARQETGGGSITVNGSKYSNKVVYNPFNIGAGSGSNPAGNALKYAYNQGWTTQAKSLNGGASFLSSGYINRGQNSIYFQKWNVANGVASVGTHQYMTNIQAPYNEAYSVKSSYASFGITNEPLTFVIPVFNNMPAVTSLP